MVLPFYKTKCAVSGKDALKNLNLIKFKKAVGDSGCPVNSKNKICTSVYAG